MVKIGIFRTFTKKYIHNLVNTKDASENSIRKNDLIIIKHFMNTHSLCISASTAIRFRC